MINQGVENGSWVDTTLGGVSAGLDVLATVSDPIGALLQYGVAWIIEHVKPLSEALDWLAGDPAQIAAHTQTWRNIAGSVRANAADMAQALATDVADWAGTAADAYRVWAADQHTAVVNLANAAATMATITQAAGVLIAGVRALVRDAIAACVSRLISYAAEEAFTLGLATPLVIEQVATLVAAWGAKIARWVRALMTSIRALLPILRRLGKIIEELRTILSRLRGKGGRPPTAPKVPKSKYHAMSREDLVKDRGANIGRPGNAGKAKDIREVKSESELKDYFDALVADGATEVTKPGFSGRMFKLDDGTIVTWRTKSKTTGSIPTVDVNPGKGLDFKIHVNPTGW